MSYNSARSPTTSAGVVPLAHPNQLRSNDMPSYHLCPNFRIPPPPNGHLTLGSILKNLEEDGVEFPLNQAKVEPIPEEAIYPRDGPHAERGFTRNITELRSLDAGVWCRIFSVAELSAKFIRSRGSGEFLTVNELLTRTFMPDDEYTTKSLENAKVRTYVTTRKLEVPVYMVTGIMIAKGASWSSRKSKTKEASGEGGGKEPNSGTSAGGKAGYSKDKETTTGVEDSDDFVLGIRVRKIWWEKDIRQESDKVAGSVLRSGSSKMSLGSPAAGLRIAEDFELDNPEASGVDKRLVVKRIPTDTEAEPVVWILP